MGIWGWRVTESVPKEAVSVTSVCFFSVANGYGNKKGGKEGGSLGEVL